MRILMHCTKFFRMPKPMKHYKEPYDSDGVRLWIEWNLESYKDFGFGLWAVLLKG